MRPSQKGRGARNKSGRKPVGNVVNRVYESAGPEGKVRGTPQQIIDKYLLLARDAQTAGDRVLSESFLQYAEHYVRLLNAAYQQNEERRQHAPQTADVSAGADYDDTEGAEGDQRREQQPRQRSNDGQGGGGLETIETSDGGDAGSGPVETPEQRRAAAPAEPSPAAPAAEQEQAAPAADAAQADGESEAAPKKRNGDGRRRRRRPAAEDGEQAESSDAGEAHAN